MTGNAAAGTVKRIRRPEFTAPVEVELDAVRGRRIVRDRKRLVRIVTLILLGIFILVGMRAYCASLQHANNKLIDENNYIQAEIDSLNNKLSQETQVTRIGRVATEDYGMVYPTSDNCVNLAEAEEQEGNLAATIRSEAYN